MTSCASSRCAMHVWQTSTILSWPKSNDDGASGGNLSGAPKMEDQMDKHAKLEKVNKLYAKVYSKYLNAKFGLTANSYDEYKHYKRLMKLGAMIMTLNMSK